MDAEALQFCFKTKPDLFQIPQKYVISYHNSGQEPHIANFCPSKA